MNRALLLSFFLVGACATSKASQSSGEALVGDWVAPAEHGVFMRFTADGKVFVALSREQLATAKTTGTWKMEQSHLTFENLTGSCSEGEAERVGRYEVQLAADTVHFTKVNDACDRRNSIDGETWARVR